MAPCRASDGSPAARPIVWSRRNGAWRRVAVLFVGAAPDNAGGRGSGSGGAHATRIPFGGDVAGANLDVLLNSVGLDRNRTFIVAALNQLPEAGGGEPTLAELAAPVGTYASSIHLLRDTLLASAPRLVVALGNVAARCVLAAGMATGPAVPRLLSVTRLNRMGVTRGSLTAWPADAAPDPALREQWADAAHGADLPSILPCWHPSAQNMSPFAAAETVFFRRMMETRDALRAAFTALQLSSTARPRPADGVYALPEWRERIGPYHDRLAALWLERGLEPGV
jgi:uracil-DNA glycosylase